MTSVQGSSSQPEVDPKTRALNGYKRRLLEHRELDAKLKESTFFPAFFFIIYMTIVSYQIYGTAKQPIPF